MYKATAVQRAQKYWTSWNISDTIEEINPSDLHVTPNTVFKHVAFYTDTDRVPSDIPYLRPAGQVDDQARLVDSLETHPIISRSFATFPPVSNLYLELSLDGEYCASNSHGVTVDHVIKTLVPQ